MIVGKAAGCWLESVDDIGDRNLAFGVESAEQI